MSEHDPTPSREPTADAPRTPPELPRQGGARRRRAPRGAGRHARQSYRTRSGRAANIVLVVAVLQILAGALFGWRSSKQADDALRELAPFAAEERIPIDGETTTVGELRDLIEKERVQAYVIPIGLGVVFLGLSFWARRSALPALVTALVLYVAAAALAALADPRTLAAGLVIKVLIVVGLVSGIKAAVAERAAARRAGELAG